MKLGPNYDRFCGGYLNVESDEEESIPVYSEVSSQIIWLQVISCGHLYEYFITHTGKPTQAEYFLPKFLYLLCNFWIDDHK